MSSGAGLNHDANNEEFSLLLDTTHDVIYNEIIATMRFSILRFSCYTTSSTVSTIFGFPFFLSYILQVLQY